MLASAAPVDGSGRDGGMLAARVEQRNGPFEEEKKRRLKAIR
jgi:hypothetical protein